MELETDFSEYFREPNADLLECACGRCGQESGIMHTKSSRRSFLKGSAALGAACVVGSSAIASPLQTSVIVVGAGAFGGWSALHLAQRGAKVTPLDAWGPGNSRAS